MISVVFTRPRRSLSRLAQNAAVSIPDIGRAAPFPSRGVARSRGFLRPTFGQLSASSKLAGIFASIPAHWNGVYRRNLASPGGGGIRRSGRKSQPDPDPCRAATHGHCAPLRCCVATSSLHLVGRTSAIPSDFNRGCIMGRQPHCRTARALRCIPMRTLGQMARVAASVDWRSDARLAP